MTRNGSIGYELNNNNKIIPESITLFAICPKCKKEEQLNKSMFSDNCKTKQSSFCGFSYICKCGNKMQIWEGAFDSCIDELYNNDMMADESEENK